jgi:ribosome biogenesis GTPase A
MSSASSKDARAAASWFPGHMAAGLRAVMDAADLIDVVLDVRDARLPHATAGAKLHQRLKSKPTFVLLNRKDLAEDAATRAWLRNLSDSGVEAFAGSATHAATLRSLRTALTAYKGKRARTRVAVVGAPNTGKSSVINSLVRRKRTVVQDRAGVTRHVRWIALDERVDILDTPGVLEPRISNKTTAWQLALCGILPESAFDMDEVIEQFGTWIARERPDFAGKVDLESFSRQRGMLRRGGEIDRRNAAGAFLREFRAGKLGRFTFEHAGEQK